MYRSLFVSRKTAVLTVMVLGMVVSVAVVSRAGDTGDHNDHVHDGHQIASKTLENGKSIANFGHMCDPRVLDKPWDLTRDQFLSMSYEEKLAEFVLRLRGSDLDPGEKQAFIGFIRQKLASHKPQTATLTRGPHRVASARTTGQLLAGAATVDVTPPIGSPSAGYGERIFDFGGPTDDPYDYAVLTMPMQGKHDPIRAKALVLDNGVKAVAFVGIDGIGSEGFFEPVLAKLQAENIPIDEDGLFLFATHTHAGPGGVSRVVWWQIFTADVFNQYLYDRLLDGITTAVKTAYNRRVAAKMATGRREYDGLARNRRGDPPKVDKGLTLTRVEALDGKPLCALFNYTAHPTSIGGSNPYFTAEFPGVAELTLEQDFGGDFVGIYYNGAEGDISPAKGGFRGVKEMGETLAGYTKEVWDTLDGQLTPTFSIETSTQVARTPPAMLGGEVFGDDLAGLSLDISGIIGDQMRFTAMRINCTEMFVSIPGEAIYDLGQIVKGFGQQYGQNVHIVGLCQDHYAYFTTTSEFYQGGYEAGLSFYGPSTGPIISGHCIDVMDNIVTRPCP